MVGNAFSDRLGRATSGLRGGYLSSRNSASKLRAPRWWRWKQRLSGFTMTDESQEETDNPSCADERNFYKVEKWSTDGERIEMLVFAGKDLDRAREVFAGFINKHPEARLTIRQRTRVLTEWFP